MFIEERMQKILDLVDKKRRVTVNEVSEYLNVSLDTVRRDFSRLTSGGLVIRTHGGIIPADQVSFDPGFSEKQQQFKNEKNAIAKVAAEYIKDNEVIIIDAGTTAEGIFSYLKKDLAGVKILTNGLNIAMKSVAKGFETIIIGGTIRNKTLSIIGPDAEEMIKNYHTDKLILATTAFSSESGAMTPHRGEAEIKRRYIHIANQVILIADHSKIEKTALYSVANIEDIDVLITDNKTDANFIKKIEEKGIEVIVAS